MVQLAPIRFYATFKTTPELLSLYRDKDFDGLARFTADLLRAALDRKRDDNATLKGAGVDSVHFVARLKIVSAPSLDWRAAFVPPRAAIKRGTAIVPRDIIPDELIISYELPDEADSSAFLGIARENLDIALDPNGNAFVGVGYDPGGSVADHWCPGSANLAIFGHRGHARRTVRADALKANAYLGQRVNVVIIDEGLDAARIPAKNWGGGLDHFIDTDLVQPAGTAPRTSHGMMIARSILDLAPEARLYDVPVIPSTIDETLPVLVSSVQAAYASLIREIRHRRKLPHWKGPWVLVNAWGILDTSADPSGSYTENTEPGGHPMNNLVTRAVEHHHLDIVFSAGNCGQFCPSEQCGRRDRGPGHSIWGANAHPLVLTAGAVRSDETWVGYSSQGPGPAKLEKQKPDLCAPSQFCETTDANLLNSGTSAACAITAGVVAALRGNPDWDQFAVTPQALKDALITSARKPNAPPGWDDRLGFGIIDAAATIAALPP